MRFTLIDQITLLEPDKKIEAVKNVTLSEEYLQDHFPRFPVLPGVLMLEALTQASAWLIRVSEDFALDLERQQIGCLGVARVCVPGVIGQVHGGRGTCRRCEGC